MKTTFKKFELSKVAQKNVLGGNETEKGIVVNVLKTKHDTVKNTISNVR
jgi:hypothetical protein